MEYDYFVPLSQRMHSLIRNKKIATQKNLNNFKVFPVDIANQISDKPTIANEVRSWTMRK